MTRPNHTGESFDGAAKLAEVDRVRGVEDEDVCKTSSTKCGKLQIIHHGTEGNTKTLLIDLYLELS
jgi:hypothetical protein